MADFKWNTAIAALMSLRNVMGDVGKARNVSSEGWTEAIEAIVKLLAPIAPHVTEEIWRVTFANPESIHLQSWPEVDSAAAQDVQVTMVVQINGKLRARIEVPVDITAASAEATAKAAPRIIELLNGLTVRKVIVREPNLVNIVAN